MPAGARYLRHLMDLFDGRLDLALAAYNAGEGAVYRAGQKIPPFKETQNYVKTVLALYRQLQPPVPGDQALAETSSRIRMTLPAGRLRQPFDEKQ
ncbi:Transglycosylase SLT domain protein [compost metagenome]